MLNYTFIKLYILCYRCKPWTIWKQDINRITACEMKFMWRTAGYTKWDQKRNEDILDKLKIRPLTYYIQNYQRKWKEHMHWMNTGRITQQILCYQPRGQSSTICPIKRGKCETITGHLP